MISGPSPFVDRHLNKAEPGILCRDCDAAWLSGGNGVSGDFEESDGVFRKGAVRHNEGCKDAKVLENVLN